MSEKKYIDADYLSQFVMPIKDHTGKIERIVLYKDIEAAPAADVEEIVRCKDCAHCDKVDDWEYWCRGRGFPYVLTVPDGYCYKGEKENEE